MESANSCDNSLDICRITNGYNAGETMVLINRFYIIRANSVDLFIGKEKR